MKKALAIILAALMLFSFAACGANEASDSIRGENAAAADYAYNGYQSDNAFYYRYENESSPSKAYAPTSSRTDSVENGRKLIRKIRLTVETDDYQAFIDSFTGKLNELGGYIEDMEANTSGSTPNATITVRVPADQLSALTESVSGIGNITYKHESQEDVTLQYTDTESHILALRTEQERLTQLLEQAQTLSEVLEIEDRMTQVRYQLENFERSLRALSNQVEYATATITVSQVVAFTPTEELGYWEKIGQGLSNSVSGLWNFLKKLFSTVVIKLPYLLILVALPVTVILLVNKHSRRKLKAKADQYAAQPGSARPIQNVPEGSMAMPRTTPDSVEKKP